MLRKLAIQIKSGGTWARKYVMSAMRGRQGAGLLLSRMFRVAPLVSGLGL